MTTAGGTTFTTTGAVGGGDLAAAAGIIADGARANAAGFSKQIPPSVKVSVSGNTATIESGVGPAYPNEVDHVRHPVFGHDVWVTNAHRPFLAPAADKLAGAAMARYAKKVDRMCRQAGFS